MGLGGARRPCHRRLAPLAYIWLRARRGLYSSSYHPGVGYIAMYWHFLDAVWLVLLRS
ncbi:MAG: hypothetical protein U0V87_03820 [Acidobacteriota bacterium]